MTLSTVRRERFAYEVAKGLSYTRAAKLAGFSEKSAQWLGSQLSRRPDVRARIAELKAAQSSPRMLFNADGTPAGFVVDLA